MKLNDKIKKNFVLAFSILSYENTLIYENLKKDLKKIFGEISYESKNLPKIELKTRILTNKVGSQTKIFSYQNLINRDNFPYLAKKVKKNLKDKLILKDEYFNIYTGYVTPYNIILGSDSDNFHKVYVTLGVYAEVIYMYQNKRLIKTKESFDFFEDKNVRYFFESLHISYML